MQRVTGTNAKTVMNLIHGPGGAYANVDLAPLLDPASLAPWDDAIVGARLMGATNGGFEFTIEPTTRRIEFDGVTGDVKGDKRLDEEKVMLVANFVEFDDANLKAMIPTADITDVGNGYKVLKPRYRLNLDDYIDNIAFFFEFGERSDYGICVIRNALSTEPFTLGTEDKEIVTNETTFTAHQDAGDPDSPAYYIFIPDPPAA